jgi:hypothetical protein
MQNKVMIPKAWVLEFDDVGWDNGRDLRLSGKASRSGLPRYHALEDYQQLADIGEAAGMSLNIALCLGDWDKDNLLRGEVGITHDPYGWDRKSEIDVEKFEKYRDAIDNSPYVDYSIHGLLHGSYDANGKLLHEKEYFDYVEVEGEGKKLVLRSEEDFKRRLDIFFKIYNSWGFKKPIKVFISPCGLGMASQKEISRIARELYKRGVRYWTNSGFFFEGTTKVINGVACVKSSFPLDPDGKRFGVPWDAYDIDPETFPDYISNCYDSCIFGMHWTNLLRFNPKKNPEQVPLWADYVKRQGEIYGLVNAKDIREAANQQFYYEMANVTYGENFVEIDLSALDGNVVDCHKNEFFLSVKRGLAPSAIEGGEIAVYEEKRDFVTYKVSHEGFDKIKIYFS